MLYLKESNLGVLNTNFVNLTSIYSPAFFGNDVNYTFKNCKFINLFANMTGGAIAVTSLMEYVNVVENCSFINVSSTRNGGAIYFEMLSSYSGAGLFVSNSQFTNCSSGFGGAILNLGGELKIQHSNFTNNLAKYQGGAIYSNITFITNIFYSNFVNNTLMNLSSELKGTAVYGFSISDGFRIRYCNFTDNMADYASAVFAEISFYSILDSYFKGNGQDIYTTFDKPSSISKNNTFADGTQKYHQQDYEWVIEGNNIDIDFNPIIIDESYASASYFNLKDFGIESAVKDQKHTENCWAFGTSTALEMALLKATGGALKANFSVNNIVFYPKCFSIYGDAESADGGDAFAANSYFLSWLGGNLNEDVAFDELGRIAIVPKSQEKFHLQGIVAFPIIDSSRNLKIYKEALVKYGALSVTVNAPNSVIKDDYNEKTYAAYYYPEPDFEEAESNHFVVLVGWDDNFSKNNFIKTPPGDGAWILQNSWGKEWGDNGYYYVSYYDNAIFTLNSPVGFVIDGNSPYTKNYQYDFAINEFVYDFAEEAKAYANVYTATGNDLIYTSANGGKFRITETKAPTNYKNNGYIKEFDITTDVNADGIVAFDDFENGAKDTGVTGSTKVAKFDKVTGEKVLSGDAEFTVYENVNGNWIESGKLVYDEPTQTYVANGVKFVFHNADGTVIDSEDIKAGKLYYTTVNDGKFKVVETKAPQFYNLDGFEKEFDITVKADNDYSSKENGAMDTGYKGNAKLVKVDRETNAKLSGAVFEVQEWNETEQNWLSVGNLSDLGNGNYTTDDMKVALHTADGNSVETNELNYTTQNLGKYRIVEVKAPEGYLNDNYESNIIEITENDKVADFTTDDVNAKDTPVKVEISKKSVTNGSDIIGAELIVTDENGKEIDKWVTDGTSHLISAIKPGKYTLTENKAPEGYVISSSIDFTVEETGDIQKVEMYDDIVRGKVVLTKTDKDTGNVLANAEFELRDEEGNVIETLVTDKDGKAESKEIFFGNYAENGKYEGSKKYTLVETKAPAGYVLDSTEIPVEFTYENDTTPVVVTEISNKNTPIKVSVSKTSITTGKPVIGATLKITDENGKEIDKWVTDGKEHILSAIPTGKYTLVEERASDGYIVANSIDFEVMETGEIQTVVMQDEEVKGHVIIHKTDKESGKPLANAVFEIRDEDGKVVDTLTTDENGNATSKDIAFGIYDEAGLYKGSHKYTIVEVKAPEGYKLDGTVTEFEFEYKDDTTPVVVKELSFTNEKTPSVTTTPPTIVKTPTPKTSTPKTGDSVNVMIILLIALAVIGVFISALLKGRTN